MNLNNALKNMFTFWKYYKDIAGSCMPRGQVLQNKNKKDLQKLNINKMTLFAPHSGVSMTLN